MTHDASMISGSTEDVEPVGGPRSSDPASEGPCALIARLSTGQIEVLRLVNGHLNSKEIAVRLGISSHTVDQRVRGAIHRLGVARRSEAARLVDEFDRANGAHQVVPPAAQTYQRLIHQASDIDGETVGIQTDVAVSFQIRHADRTGGVGAVSLETEQRWTAVRPPLLPWSTPQQPGNGWNVGQRLAVIAGIAIGASFSAGMLLAGLESLSRLIRP